MRYYQKIAVDRVVQALINNKERILLTLATGTGKTAIAFALCYRLLEARWNLENANRKPKILFLCDRVTLRNQALSEFNYIESDCKEISAEELKKNGGRVPTSGDVFFGIYQSLSSADKSQREEKGVQDDKGSTQERIESKFHLQYSKDFFDLIIIDECHRSGANDGYKHNPDDLVQGKLEKGYYELGEFERTITFPKYNEFIAKKILELINPMDKTIIFCANQAHASAMKVSIDKFKKIPRDDYCVRVTSDEGVIGLNYLKAFQDNDKSYPVILTSSKMLTTGVDARNVRNIVLLANIGSMIEFKQIIGRGADFFGVTKLFYDPKWDGEGNTINGDDEEDTKSIKEGKSGSKGSDIPKEKVIIHLKGTKLKVLDIETRYIGGDGKPLGTKEFLGFLIGKLGNLYNNEKKLKEMWSNAENRQAFLKSLANDGIDSEVLENLKEIFERKDCDIYDILAHISFNSEIVSRSERVLSVKNSGFLSKFHKERAIKLIEFLLVYYEEHGIDDFNNIGRLLELSSLGKAYEIAEDFGGISMLRSSIEELQREIYGV